MTSQQYIIPLLISLDDVFTVPHMSVLFVGSAQRNTYNWIMDIQTNMRKILVTACRAFGCRAFGSGEFRVSECLFNSNYRMISISRYSYITNFIFNRFYKSIRNILSVTISVSENIVNNGQTALLVIPNSLAIFLGLWVLSQHLDNKQSFNFILSWFNHFFISVDSN